MTTEAGVALVEAAIREGLLVLRDESGYFAEHWKLWAGRWLDGSDRSDQSAEEACRLGWHVPAAWQGAHQARLFALRTGPFRELEEEPLDAEGVKRLCEKRRRTS